MNGFTEDDQDFVAVKNKSKNSSSNTTQHRRQHGRRQNKKGKGRYEPPAEKALSVLLQQKIDLLRGSPFVQASLDLLQKNLSTSRRAECKKCLCFGLGSLRHSPKSLLQLALLQLLLELEYTDLSSKPISMDPEFIDEDKDFLESLGHEVIDYRDDILDLTEDTLLYMPHCPRWLYEQLLETNGKKLGRIVLLANDLSLYADRELRADELKKIPRLAELGDTFKTFTLPEFDERPDAFNDMAWQWTAENVTDQTSSVERGSTELQIEELVVFVASLSVEGTLSKA